MDILEGNSKRRKICDSVQAPGAHKAPSPHEGFQIEQSNEGGFRIVRIRNANTISPNSEKDSSSEHETTPQPTQGKKRSRDEMQNGVNTIVARATQSLGPSAGVTTRLLQQSTGELHEDENMGISKQALKRQLKKSATVIIQMFTKRMDKVKSRMNKLEQENKELQQLASNLRDTLQDVIQQQKQKKGLMVSRGTQVSMRVVFKPVMSSNKDGAFPRIRNLSCFHQDASTVYFSPNRDASTYRSDVEHLQGHSTEEGNHQHIGMKKASSAMPLEEALVEGNTKSVSSGSITPRENTTKMVEGCFSKSTNLIPNQTFTSSSPSVVTASKIVPSILKIPIGRLKLGNLHPHDPLVPGFVGSNTISPSNCSKTQHWMTNTASGVPHTKENELLSYDGCQSSLTNIYSPSNTQESMNDSNTVHSSSSNESSLADTALLKLISSSSQTKQLPSSQKRDLDRKYSPAESISPNTSSSLLSNGRRCRYSHLSPNGLHLKSAPSGLLPSQNGDVQQEHVQQEHVQQETQFMNIPSGIPPCQERGHKKSQGTNTQSREKSVLYIPTAPKLSQLSHIHTNVLSRHDQTPQESQLSNTLSAPLWHPYKRITPKYSQFMMNTEHQETKLTNTPINLQSRNERSLYKNGSSQLSQFSDTGQYEERSSQESRLRSTPPSPLSRQEIGQRNGSSPKSRVMSTASRLLSRREELSLRNGSTNGLCSSSFSSTHDRPNSNIMEQSSHNFSGKRVPLQTGSSNLSTGYNKQMKPLQMPGFSKELLSKESRFLTVQKIVTETLEQRYRHNTAPSNLLLRRKPFPLKSYQTMDIPITTAHLMEGGWNSRANTPSKVIQHMQANSHEGSSSTPLPERSNINKNSEGQTPTRLNSSQGIRTIQPWSRKDHGIRSNPRNGDQSTAKPEV